MLEWIFESCRDILRNNVQYLLKEADQQIQSLNSNVDKFRPW